MHVYKIFNIIMHACIHNPCMTCRSDLISIVVNKKILILLYNIGLFGVAFPSQLQHRYGLCIRSRHDKGSEALV